MNGKTQGELILFPKTIDYYQIELTKLLETEAYAEAVRMLEFLVECKTGDGRANEEWLTLLDWLSNEFPVTAKPGAPAAEEDEQSAGEEELLRQHVTVKMSQDKQYVNRLLGSLQHASMDKQMLALEQLAFVEDSGIAEELTRRLIDSQLHPFVSFKLLQTLARLGVTGELTFGKLGEIVTVEVERTPLGHEPFPEPLSSVWERVNQVAEVDDPTVSYFAQQTWQEFLTFAYGATVYRYLLASGEQELDVWACALHAAVAQAMYGSGNADELKDRYGITEMLIPDWERAYASLSRFFRDSAGLHV
jgi:hypothetical protein